MNPSAKVYLALMIRVFILDRYRLGAQQNSWWAVLGFLLQQRAQNNGPRACASGLRTQYLSSLQNRTVSSLTMELGKQTQTQSHTPSWHRMATKVLEVLEALDNANSQAKRDNFMMGQVFLQWVDGIQTSAFGRRHPFGKN